MKELDDALTKELVSAISRRDMLKLSALLGAGALLDAPKLFAGDDNNTTLPKVALGEKIVIVGGGDAGISISARLCNAIENPNITLIDPNPTHYYQPGQTLIGGGVWKLSDIAYALKEHLPREVQLIESSATAFDPDHNALTLANGEKITYDYLVVATGLEYHYEAIKGITRTMLGTFGMHSIYAPEDTERTFVMFENIAKISHSKKVRAIFTHPDTPIKCGGAPKKIMMLFEHYMRLEGKRENVEVIFAAAGGSHFGLEPYNGVLAKAFKDRSIVEKFNHNLVGVDAPNQTATFMHTYQEQGEWDADLEEYDMVTRTKEVSISYDFLHITPPMWANDAVKSSQLAWQKGGNAAMGFIEVDDVTLQHKRFPNVFAAGDVIGTKYGKTGGSVRKQAPVVAYNLLHVMQGKLERQAYDGYTVCPLIMGYGSILLAEFNYAGVTASFPLDPAKERWIWWLLKVYMLKPIYFYGMLKGRM
ncbi:MAG: hypothetical protein KU37_03440 [Sulfuricurvum sp. PC08-66]|nr:MAG: hypothetical protein KU37_03440 [Sulfuricurvum sp. PC08-66]